MRSRWLLLMLARLRRWYRFPHQAPWAAGELRQLTESSRSHRRGRGAS